jgi:Putative MetA-pathway of phenol degradation
MPDAKRTRPRVSIRCWAGVAVAVPAIGLASVGSQTVSGASPGLEPSAGRAAEFKRIAVYLERVLAGDRDPAPPVGDVAKPPDHPGSAPTPIAAEPAAPPLTERKAEYARVVDHVERVVAGVSDVEPAVRPAAPPAEEMLVEAAAIPPTPQLKPRVEPAATPTMPAPEGIVAESAATAATPELKPREDRSREVLALLKHAIVTSPEAEASTSPPDHPAPSAIRARRDKPAPKPQMPPADPVVADAPPRMEIVPAQAPGGDVVPDDPLEALRRELRLRDAVIAELLQRVEHLEQRMVLNDSQLDQTVGGAGPMSVLRQPGAGVTAPAAPNAPAVPTPPVAQGIETPNPARTAQAENTQAGDQGTSAPPAAPGQFTVDESAADRALERTLVQEGVLLLPLGQAEIQPGFTYTRQEVDAPTFVTQNGNTFVAEQKLRRNEFGSQTALRVGLPWDSQVEVAVPYEYVDQSVVTSVGNAPQSNDSESGMGLGDITVGFAKTLLQENGGWWPDVVARASWDAPTGKEQDNGVFLGGGFNALSGSLNLVKRQDPLAFVGGVGYTKGFENNDIEPGDELGFSIGTVLAASPETSLSFIFNQSFANETRIDGDKVDGSDDVSGTFSIGAATTLGPNTLLSVTGEIGLTDEAPDYAIGVSLPIRFNVPTY